MSEGTPNPFETPPSGGGGNPAEAARMIATPAMALLILAAIHAAVGAIGIIVNLLGIGAAALQNQNLPAVTSNPLAGVIGIAIQVLIVFGALKMKNLEMYGLAMASAILSCVPCISPCCILGIPFGIWALMVLVKPEVKSAFVS